MLTEESDINYRPQVTLGIISALFYRVSRLLFNQGAIRTIFDTVTPLLDDTQFLKQQQMNIIYLHALEMHLLVQFKEEIAAHITCHIPYFEQDLSRFSLTSPSPSKERVMAWVSAVEQKLQYAFFFDTKLRSLLAPIDLVDGRSVAQGSPNNQRQAPTSEKRKNGQTASILPESTPKRSKGESSFVSGSSFLAGKSESTSKGMRMNVFTKPPLLISGQLAKHASEENVGCLVIIHQGEFWERKQVEEIVKDKLQRQLVTQISGDWLEHPTDTAVDIGQSLEIQGVQNSTETVLLGQGDVPFWQHNDSPIALRNLTSLRRMLSPIMGILRGNNPSEFVLQNSLMDFCLKLSEDRMELKNRLVLYAVMFRVYLQHYAVDSSVCAIYSNMLDLIIKVLKRSGGITYYRGTRLDFDHLSINDLPLPFDKSPCGRFSNIAFQETARLRFCFIRIVHPAQARKVIGRERNKNHDRNKDGK